MRLLHEIETPTNDQPVKVQDCMKITDHFRGIDRIYLNLIKENWRMSTGWICKH